MDKPEFDPFAQFSQRLEKSPESQPIEIATNRPRSGIETTPSITIPWDWYAVLRDTVMIIAFGFISGFILSFAGIKMEDQRPAYLATGYFLSIAGFMIVGCRTPTYRIRQAIIVVLGAWIFSSTDMFWGTPYKEWLRSIIPQFIMMGIGIGLSYLMVPMAASPTGKAKD